MKDLFYVTNHVKIALGLFVLLSIIVLTSLLEKQKLKTVERNVLSIFADRLVPATDIFFISDQLYKRRLSLQNFILSPESVDINSLSNKSQEKVIDSLLQKYQKTYLIESEEVCLKDLTNKWEEYKVQEENILNLSKNNQHVEAKAVFNSRSKMLFNRIITDLQLLTTIQSSVGEDLTDTSRSSIVSADSIFALQISITIIIGLICNGFLLTSRIPKHPNQKFHLN